MSERKAGSSSSERRTSPRKRTYSAANKDRDRSRSNTGNHSPAPRCDSVTRAEYETSGKKQRKACWSPIKPFDTESTTEFPKLEIKKLPKPPAEVSFDELLASFSKPCDKSWAELVEEETSRLNSSNASAKKTSEKSEDSSNKRRQKCKYVHSDQLTSEISERILSHNQPESSSDSLSCPRRSRRSDRNFRPTCSSPISPRKRYSAACSGRKSGSISPEGSPIGRSDSRRREQNKRSFPRKSKQSLKERLGDKQSASDRLGYFTKKDTSDSCHQRPHRRREAPKWFPNPEEWQEPKLGFVEDDSVVQKREKELQKGYNSEVYKRYIQEVPKKDRVKGVHPRTPNKWINYSRRSWDMQVRIWRKMLYVWAGEVPSSDASFLSSDSNYTVSSNDDDEESSATDRSETSGLSVETDPDELANLLCDYDIDSRKGLTQEDNTMPAPSGKKLNSSGDEDTLTVAMGNEDGPVDFSSLASNA